VQQPDPSRPSAGQFTLPDGPFALIRRGAEPTAEFLRGPVEVHTWLADLPTETAELLVLVPYRQLLERGDECHDDGAPLLAMRVAERARVPLAALPRAPRPTLIDGRFDVDDDSYARAVKRVLDEEIGAGAGSNFVLRRTFVGHCDGDPRAAALGAFHALLAAERNAYWTFLIDTGFPGPHRFLVGATPERHVSLAGGVAVMNPISGTLREPPATASRERVLAFLADPKERDELAMVVDEELKMLAEVGDLGGRVRGPYLKEMANLAHTEYYIEARTTMDPRHILRETMFAPTATGSPIRNAFRVIKRHESGGRGYYGGVVALIGKDAAGAPTMDAPLLLRVAYLDERGTVRVPVGATLVRGSDPWAEVRETYAKSAGVLRSFGIGDQGSPTLDGSIEHAADADHDAHHHADQDAGTASASTALWADDPEIRAVLASRNTTLSPYWRTEHAPGELAAPELAGRSVLIIDNEDAFTSMLAVELRTLGLAVTRLPYSDVVRTDSHDLVLLGPGPGDPADESSPRIRAVRAFARDLIASGRPVLGLCLGHQALGAALGLELTRLPIPVQGTQLVIDLFGHQERVGFYNSFAVRTPAVPLARLSTEPIPIPGAEVLAALRGPTFTGLQFHPESVLTMDGLGILRREIGRLLTGREPR
jgi:phenazine biosynthesis protein phzE